MSTQEEALPLPDWSWPQRVGFRFVFAFALLIAAPFPFYIFPSFDPVSQPWNGVWIRVVQTFATHVLDLPTLASLENGSGDRTIDYVLHLVCVLAAAIIAILWSALSRARAYDRLHEALRLFLRSWLGVVLLSYGFAKVFKTQMPALTGSDLLQTYGNSSPMGLLWRFMGFSTPYTVFAGLMEVIPGLLLFFRRTTLLGALLAVGVMGNVVMLNFCYDVPVKLFSTTLLATAAFLAAPSLRRMFDLVVLGKEVAAVARPTPLATGRRRSVGRIVLVVTLAASTADMVQSSWKRYITRGDRRPNRGRDVFDAFDVVEKSDHPAAVSWRRIGFRPGGMWVAGADGRRQILATAARFTGPGTLTLHDWDDTSRRRVAILTLSGEGDHYVLEGTWECAPLRLVLVRHPTGDSLLINRGFRFINEVPFNR